MTITAELSEISRRRILGGALATSFVLAFHVPVGAAEPAQPKDPADGKFARTRISASTEPAKLRS